MTKKTDSKPRKVGGNKYISEIEKAVSELMEKLTVEAKIEVVEEKSEPAGAKAIAGEEGESQPKSFRVNIESAESGLLIGHHGETINSLQLLLGVILYKKFNEWIRVIIDVGDYRKMREESIRDMVNRISAEVIQTGKGVELPYLSPLERRLVHLMLSANEKVESISQGEGKDRRVTIKPR